MLQNLNKSFLQTFTKHQNLPPSLKLSLSHLSDSTPHPPLSASQTSHSALDLFKTHGFSAPQISTLLSSAPHLLLAAADSPLAPNLHLLRGLGLSPQDLASLISSNPSILLRNRARPNVALLRRSGLPDARIASMALAEPSLLLASTARMRDAVRRAERLGLPRGSVTHAMAVRTMCSTKRSAWDARVGLLENLGWSRDEIAEAFRKVPMFMRCSEKKIEAGMDFFVKEARWSPRDVACDPMLLMYSLKKTVMPRCRIWKLLRYKELVDEGELRIILKLSENEFVTNYVDKFEEDIPYLAKAYKGELHFKWLDIKDVGRIQNS